MPVSQGLSRNNWSGSISGPADQLRRVIIIGPGGLQLVPHGSILKMDEKKMCCTKYLCT